MNEARPSAQDLGIRGTLPWTRTCFVCGESNPHGLHLRSRAEGDRVVIEYTPREADLGYRHIVHGGITATLLDEVMTWAANLVARQACVAAELTVRLKRPVVAGQPIRVEGWTSSVYERLIMTEGAALSAGGELLAMSRGKYVPMPGDGVRLCEKDFVVSPDSIHPARLFEPGTPGPSPTPAP